MSITVKTSQKVLDQVDELFQQMGVPKHPGPFFYTMGTHVLVEVISGSDFWKLYFDDKGDFCEAWMINDSTSKQLYPKKG